MLVPLTADGFRARVIALRSRYGRNGVSFHTSLPENLRVRLLIKNLRRQIPDDVVREELGILGICVQGFLQLRSGSREHETSRACPLTPHLCR